MSPGPVAGRSDFVAVFVGVVEVGVDCEEFDDGFVLELDDGSFALGVVSLEGLFSDLPSSDFDSSVCTAIGAGLSLSFSLRKAQRPP